MQYKKRYLIAASSLFVGAAFLANADSLQTVLTENTAWDNLYWTPSETLTPADDATINGGGFTVTVDGQVHSDPIHVNSLKLIDGGSTLELLNGAFLAVNTSQASPATGDNAFQFTNLKIDSSTLAWGTITENGDGTYSYGKNGSFGLWWSNLEATNATIYGGMQAWHGSGSNTINVTDSTIIANGVSLFEMQGNGGTTANFSGTTMTSEATSTNQDGINTYGNLFSFYSHNANENSKFIANISDSSKVKAGDTNGYAVVSGGGNSFLLWDANYNSNEGESASKAPWVEININSGSSVIGGNFANIQVPNNSVKDGHLFLNIDGEGTEAWFTSMEFRLSSNQTSTFETGISVTNGASLHATEIRIGGSGNINNADYVYAGNSGTASLTLGDNSSVDILYSDGATGGYLNVGAYNYGTINGGNSKVVMNASGATLNAGRLQLGRGTFKGGNNSFEISGTEDTRSVATFTGRDGASIALENSSVEGGTTSNSLIIGSNADVIGYSDILMTAANVVAGNSSIVMNGSNSNITLSRPITEGDNAGRDQKWNLQVGSNNAALGGVNRVEILGSGNTVDLAATYLGNANSMAGENYVMVQSSDASKMNVYTGFQVALRNSTLEGSTQKNTFIIGSNTSIPGRINPDNGDVSFRPNVATDVSASGTSEFIIRGSNIEFGYLFQLNAGNAASTGGVGKISIQSSDIRANSQDYMHVANNISILGGANYSKENPVAILELKADANGFARISADRIFMTGLLVVDFSDLRGTYEDGISFDLLEYRNGNEDADGSRFAWLTLCEAIAGGDYEHVNIITRDESDEFWFELNGSTLTVTYYSSVPEPATFAAIFGALALALAAYRKRK